MKLLDITQLQILQLLKKMDAKGLQFESRNKVRILLEDMFDKAMINDMLYKNPAKGISIISLCNQNTNAKYSKIG